MNLQGKWKTRAGYKAEVGELVGDKWFGYVSIPLGFQKIISVPTYWSLDGHSNHAELDLMERARGEEVF